MKTSRNSKVPKLEICDITCLGKGWREVDQYDSNGPFQVGLFLGDFYFLYLVFIFQNFHKEHVFLS